MLETNTLKAACIQMDCDCMDFEANYQKAYDLLTTARDDGAELAVLPELFDTGYCLDAIKKSPLEKGRTLRFLSEAAVKLGMAVGAGYLEIADVGLYDSFAVFNAQGKQIANYRKNRLFPGEDLVFQPGKEGAFFELNNFRIGISICFDLRFSEIFQNYAESGCHVLIVSSAFPAARKRHWKTLLEARAIENQSYILASNRCGEDEGLSFCGDSCVIDPWGEVMAQAGPNEEKVVQAMLEMNRVNEVREKIPMNRFKNR